MYEVFTSSLKTCELTKEKLYMCEHCQKWNDEVLVFTSSLKKYIRTRQRENLCV